MQEVIQIHVNSKDLDLFDQSRNRLAAMSNSRDLENLHTMHKNCA